MFFVILGPALLVATSVFSLVQIDTKHARPAVSAPSFTNDTMVEVIRNITKVNDALQELIKNYEQLIYKTNSFEASEDYPTDTEIDERYKVKYKKKNRTKITEVTENPLGDYHSTRITVLEDTVASDAENDNNTEETEDEGFFSDAIQQNRLPTIENLQAQSSPSKNEITPNSPETSVSDEEDEKEMVSEQTTSSQKPSEIIFIDTHKRLYNTFKSAHKPEASIEPIRPQEPDANFRKSRYNKSNHRNNFWTGSQHDVSLSMNVSLPKGNDSKSEIHTESGSKVKEENSKREPNKIQGDANDTSEINNRKVSMERILRPDTTALIGEKGSKSPRSKKVRTRHRAPINKGADADFEAVAEEKELDKEMFKTHVLRQAFGEACTKLVVRNCYKACQEAVKRTCTGTTCKSSFKQTFLNYSRTNCIQQFDAPKSQYDTKSSANLFRTRGIIFPTEDHWAAACWPLRKTKKPVKIHKSKSNPTSLKPDEELRMLRNRYESACQATMMDRCNKACKDSFESGCKSEECPRSREDRFKDNCNRGCSEVFKPKRLSKDSGSSGSSDSSGSSSSGSSGSGSDSGSDSDSSSDKDRKKHR